MEIREIKAFVVLAEELNFRKAAERLHMSQPPLTRLITQLEYDLDVKLFQRTTRKVELTGAGLHLLKKGKEILEKIESTEFEVRSLRKNKQGKLKISLTAGSFHSSVPRILSAFKEQFPKMNVEMIETPNQLISSSLRSGKIDMAFMVSDPELENFNLIEVQRQELGILIPKLNPLARKKMISLKDLDGEILIFHGKHDKLGFQAEFLHYLNSKGIHPRIYYKKMKESCSHLVTLEQGLLLTTRTMANLVPETQFVPFMDFSKKLKIYGVWSEGNSSLELAAFINFLSEEASVPGSELDSHFN